MARIAGVNIPTNKRFVIALTYIYGIGRSRAEKICKDLNINTLLRTPEIDEETLKRVRDYITAQTEKDAESDGSEVLLIEGDLRRNVALNIKRLVEINCYRGTRHRKGLPCRGQRTKTNARTRKGPKKTIANKKK